MHCGKDAICYQGPIRKIEVTTKLIHKTSTNKLERQVIILTQQLAIMNIKMESLAHNHNIIEAHNHNIMI